MSQPAITSLQNPRVKEALKLRDHRQRKKQGRFLIDGARELDRALVAETKLVEVFLCESMCTSAESQQVLARLADATVCHRCGDPDIWSVSPAVLEKLAFGGRAEGTVGVGRATSRTLSELSLPEKPLIAVLDGLEKPGNVGAVLRTADAAGVDAVVIADGGTDLYNPNTIRASLGTVFTVPVYAASVAETLAWLRARRIRIYTARLDATLDYTRAELHVGAAIVLGSESTGLSPSWSVDDVVPIRLPMLGIADSLNVSAAAAVLFYEALRQRNHP